MKQNKKNWLITWKGSSVKLELTDRSKEEAYNIAILLGYKKPKWFEFWKGKITMIDYQAKDGLTGEIE